ncbi:hypothetical protein COF68_05065 [Bacillus toyonensis]|uniref:hypothetical protein n=1 Tax=Bacillus toyonensis TaxID=155322 RepID=UPI000BFE2533|nr:hypothetical protein [Bacillus toyonensis]PHE64217.1 hypothetical protein COF68_05065 [Bacillus toyonensis]
MFPKYQEGMTLVKYIKTNKDNNKTIDNIELYLPNQVKPEKSNITEELLPTELHGISCVLSDTFDRASIEGLEVQTYKLEQVNSFNIAIYEEAYGEYKGEIDIIYVYHTIYDNEDLAEFNTKEELEEWLKGKGLKLPEPYRIEQADEDTEHKIYAYNIQY